MFTSCKKENASPPVNGNTGNGIKPTDVDAVSGSLTVWHSSKITGSFPAAGNNANTPVLYQDLYYSNIKTVSGKYAIMLPNIASGEVTGYYVQVKNAGVYFKINYGAAPNPKDSAIIIQLPAGIQTGSFTLLISAYDAAGNTSAPVEIKIAVEKLGSTDATSFTGSWKLTGTKTGIQPWDYNLYERKDGQMMVYNCIDNHLAGIYSNMNPLSNVRLSLSKTDLKKNQIDFTAAGDLSSDIQEDGYLIDEVNSSCNNPVYNYSTDFSYYRQQQSGWIYNAATKKIIFMYNYIIPDLSRGITYYYEYDVLENTGSKLVLKDNSDNYKEYTKL